MIVVPAKWMNSYVKGWRVISDVAVAELKGKVPSGRAEPQERAPYANIVVVPVETGGLCSKAKNYLNAFHQDYLGDWLITTPFSLTASSQARVTLIQKTKSGLPPVTTNWYDQVNFVGFYRPIANFICFAKLIYVC
jgi:hypothetical protein